MLWLAVVILSAAGYWGREDWRLDLLANFKMQYYLGALVLCVVTAWRSFRILLGLSLLLLLWNGILIFNFALQSSETSGRVYRAISANVYTRNTQIDRVTAWIREQEPDFVALIEITDAWMPTLEELKDVYPYERRQMWGGRYGSVVLSKYPPTAEGASHSYAGVGSLPYEVMTPDGPLIILLMHPLSPTNERSWKYRKNALGAIAKYVTDNADRAPMLVMGDMNTTPWSPFYTDFVAQSELNPVVTSFLPRRTWPTHNPFLWVPIDHFFLTDQLAPVNEWTGPDVGSDHYPIGLDFYFATQSEAK